MGIGVGSSGKGRDGVERSDWKWREGGMGRGGKGKRGARKMEERMGKEGQEVRSGK